MPKRTVLASVVLLLPVLAGCDAHVGSRAATATSASPRPDEASTTPFTPVPRSSAPAPLPDLTVSAAADRVIGDGRAQAGWAALAAWIQSTGFRPDLIRTNQPTQTQLAPVTAFMTTACRAAFDGYVSDVTTEHTNSLEAVTSIGVAAQNATVAEGDAAVSDIVITSALADVDNRGELIIAVASSARIHLVTSDNTARAVERTLTRTTTYTLVAIDARWLLDAWQGTYDLSPVSDDSSS